MNERHTSGSQYTQSNNRYGNVGSTSTGAGVGGNTYKRTVEEVRNPSTTGYSQPSGGYNNYGYETKTTTTTTKTSAGDYGTHSQGYRQPEDTRREANINVGQGDNYLQAGIVDVADLSNVAVGEPVHHAGRIIEETITKRIDVDVDNIPTGGHVSYESRTGHIAIEVEEKIVYKDDL